MPKERRHPHPERMCGKGRMRQFVAYLRKTLRLPYLLEQHHRDGRRNPRFQGSTCFMLTLVMLLMRYRSFNSFEDLLRDPPMRKLFRGRDLPECTQTIKNAHKKTDLKTLEGIHQTVLKIAAKNKVFDKTKLHDKRFFAFDGVEPVCSRKRACKACLTRTFDTADGEVTEYHHRFVFLQSIGPSPNLLLGFEPQANLVDRKAKDSQATKAEGELTAVKPLVQRLLDIFPRLFFAGVGDALYSNGPMVTFLLHGDSPLNIVAVLKKETDEPMADAIHVFAKMQPTYYYDKTRKEHVRMWDSEGFEGLSSCPDPLRVIKAQVFKGRKRLDPKKIDWNSDPAVHTWWMVTGVATDQLSGAQIFDVLRHRWDEENCAFNDMTQNWFFKHVFLHHEVGLQVMMYAFMIAYNLFQLFLYRCLRHFASSKVTALSIVDQLKRDYATITDPQDGLYACCDTS